MSTDELNACGQCAINTIKNNGNLTQCANVCNNLSNSAQSCVINEIRNANSNFASEYEITPERIATVCAVHLSGVSYAKMPELGEARFV